MYFPLPCQQAHLLQNHLHDDLLRYFVPEGSMKMTLSALILHMSKSVGSKFLYYIYLKRILVNIYNNTMLLPNSKNVGLPHFVRVVIELFFRAPNHRRRMYCYWIRHDPYHFYYHLLVFEIRYSE